MRDLLEAVLPLREEHLGGDGVGGTVIECLPMYVDPVPGYALPRWSIPMVLEGDGRDGEEASIEARPHGEPVLEHVMEELSITPERNNLVGYREDLRDGLVRERPSLDELIRPDGSIVDDGHIGAEVQSQQVGVEVTEITLLRPHDAETSLQVHQRVPQQPLSVLQVVLHLLVDVG